MVCTITSDQTVGWLLVRLLLVLSTLELGVTNQQLVAIDWFTGGFCVDSLHREQAQGLMYSQATVRGKFSRAMLVAKWCHALI